MLFIVQDLGLGATHDQEAVLELCRKVIEELPEESELVRNGHRPLLNKLIGRALKLSNGSADVNEVESTFRNILLDRSST